MKQVTGLSRSSASRDDRVEGLVTKIHEIGLARFVGRIQSGVVAMDAGYEAVDRFVAIEKQRPFVARLSQALAGRTDSYDKMGR